jgi:predicted transcriptional regulator/CheY-like chemotaxis protein
MWDTSNVRGLLVFLYGLTPLDLNLVIILLKSRQPLSLEQIAAEAAREKSTVFRSLQKLVLHRICMKEVRNLKEGGYYHVYTINDIQKIKETTREKLEQLRHNIDDALRRFENDLNEMANPASVRVLIAEDEPGIAQTYRIALESKGHVVTLTDNGEDCLTEYRQAAAKSDGKTLDRLPFDVVILDYRMPKKDGLGVAKEIFSINPGQRIIFASAYLKDVLVESLSSLGQVVELLHKPFDLDTLTNAVEDTNMKDKMERMIHVIEPLKNNLSENQVTELFKLMTERKK